MSKKKILFEDPDEHYIGNIWGWRNSFIGLGILLFFSALYLYRIYTVPPETSPEQQTFVQEEKVDSLSVHQDTLGKEILFKQ